MNKIVEKAKIGALKTSNFILQYSSQITVFFICVTMLGLCYDGMIVSAETEQQTAQKLMKNILSIIGFAANVMGVGVGAMAILHFASAQADGDGPAKTKAIQQIAAAAVLLAVGTLLSTEASRKWLIDSITGITFVTQ